MRALTEVKEENYYTVYLPAYNDQRIIEVLSKLDADFMVSSKHCAGSRKEGNVEFSPINNNRYLESLSACKGVICGAGFEGP